MRAGEDESFDDLRVLVADHPAEDEGRGVDGRDARERSDLVGAGASALLFERDVVGVSEGSAVPLGCAEGAEHTCGQGQHEAADQRNDDRSGGRPLPVAAKLAAYAVPDGTHPGQ